MPSIASANSLVALVKTTVPSIVIDASSAGSNSVKLVETKSFKGFVALSAVPSVFDPVTVIALSTPVSAAVIMSRCSPLLSVIIVAITLSLSSASLILSLMSSNVSSASVVIENEISPSPSAICEAVAKSKVPSGNAVSDAY